MRFEARLRCAYDVRCESARTLRPAAVAVRSRFQRIANTAGVLAIMIYSTGVFLLCIGSCLSAPVDEPIRVDLPVYDQPQASSNLEPAPVEPMHRSEAARSDKSIVGNLISHKLQAAGAIGHKIAHNYAHEGVEQYGAGYFGAPVSALDGAILETEGYGSRKLTFKENLHGIVAGLLQPKPIVDTIREEEKYGNSGDKFYTAGRAIVSGAEGVSNLVNSVLEVPGSIFRKITRIATEKLNNLGGKLIGL